MNKLTRIFMVVLYVAAAALAWVAIGLNADRAVDVAFLARAGWPAQYAGVIADNKIQALWHAAVLAGLLGVFVQSLGRIRNRVSSFWKPVLFLVPVLVVAADAVLLSAHYVKVLPPGYIEENAVTRYLKEHIGRQRVAMVTQEGFYNLWLTYLFPYHQIVAFNVTQMPRMPQDYKRFLEIGGRNPLRMWQLSAVGFLMGPAGFEKQLPADQYKPVLRYDVLTGSDGSIAVRPDEKGRQLVVQCTAPAPRYALIGGCEKMSDESALAKLGAAEWKPFEKVILPQDSAQSDPGGKGFCGSVEVLNYRQGRAVVRVQAEAPGFLRVANKYDPYWKALVDGRPAEVQRADFIFQAVFVPAGTHEVELHYIVPKTTLWLQLVGVGLCVIAGIALIGGKIERK